MAGVTRIAVIDPQPAVRAGLTMLLRTEPGLVPVGAAAGAHDGARLAERLRPDVVLLEPHLLDGDGLGLCRRLRAGRAGIDPPRVVLYHAEPDPSLALIARIAGADGLVDKSAEPAELFDAVRVVARGGSALPPVDAEQFESVAQRVDPEDLALLAMLADGAEPAEVAEALRLDERRVARRIDRLLGRLRAREPAGAAAA